MNLCGALVAILLISTTAAAQGRVGRPAMQPPRVVRSAPPIVSPFRSAPVGPVVGGVPRFGHDFRRSGSGFGRFHGPAIIAPVVPFYTYPYFSPLAPVTPYYPAQTYVPDPVLPAYHEHSTIDSLTNQIYQLRGQIQQLQSEIAAERVAPAPAPEAKPSAPEQPATPMVLIFRDGRRLETQGYAIAGGMLYVIGDNAMKVPLSELNIAETRAENAKRGLTFKTP